MYTNPMKGRRYTDEEKKRISEATKSAMQRPEVQKKLRKPRPNGSISKQGERNPMFGKHQDQETRDKRRESMGDKQTGELNPAYKGEEASPSAIHIWLRKRHPLTGVCSNCDEEKYTERAFLRWPEPYTRDPDDYAEMCRSCHMKYDFETGERQ